MVAPPTLNPYKTMLLTFDPKRVYGWDGEFISLLQSVAAAEPASQAIYGIRAIGKSTLLKFLKHPRGAVVRYEKYLHAGFARGGLQRLMWIYINFHHFQADTHIFYVMYEALYDELDLADLLVALSAPDPDPQRSKRQTANLLKKILTRLDRTHQTRVVFLLDDFDIPLHSDHIGRDEDRQLRSITDVASMVIATDEPLSQMLASDVRVDSPLLGILTPQQIGLISEDAARQLVTDPARDVDVSYTPAEVDMLIDIGGRLPYLLTVTCETYFDMRAALPEAPHKATQDDQFAHLRKQIMNRLLVLPHVSNVLGLMWNKHEPQQDTLVEMARVERDGIPGGENAHHLVTRGLAFAEPTTGNYRIFSALFADFVRKQANIRRTSTNAREAQLTQIAENLSPIDRAVFEHLVAHEGEVCSFDELLKTVWANGDGTKRALEAAVHRLRRDVPPGHMIKNIRGRGYQYLLPDRAPS